MYSDSGSQSPSDQSTTLFQSHDINHGPEIEAENVPQQDLENSMHSSPKEFFRTHDCELKSQDPPQLLSSMSTAEHIGSNVSMETFAEPPERTINLRDFEPTAEIRDSPRTVWRTSKMKNHQGMMAAAIKRMCKKIAKTGKETKLFRTATVRLNEERKMDFLKWVLTYKKTYKTWNKLRIFFSEEDAEFGRIFAEMIMFLLTDLFEDEYSEWIQNGRMSPENKVLLEEKESKDFYAWKFTLLRDELLGFEVDFKNKIKKPRETPIKKIKN